MAKIVTFSFRIPDKLESCIEGAVKSFVKDFFTSQNEETSEVFVTVAHSKPREERKMTDAEVERVTANRSQVITPRPPRY